MNFLPGLITYRIGPHSDDAPAVLGDEWAESDVLFLQPQASQPSENPAM